MPPRSRPAIVAAPDVAPDRDGFGRPVRSAHWRWTMAPIRAFGFPVAAWAPVAAPLTGLPDLVGVKPLFLLLAFSLAVFLLFERYKLTPRVGLGRLGAMIRGRVALAVATDPLPKRDRGGTP